MGLPSRTPPPIADLKFFSIVPIKNKKKITILFEKKVERKYKIFFKTPQWIKLFTMSVLSIPQVPTGITLAVMTPLTAQLFNMYYRKKKYTPNVLTTVYSSNETDILICPAVAESQAKKMKISFEKHMLHIWVHALMHATKKNHSPKNTAHELKIVKKVLTKYSHST
ncbi:MAG: rRNA maturation RNAse YbeY [Alphaproteobacteria bacterium]|nr:rRNA maturation RNAse YbeY [Alphaproteobacteria bacterium]